MSTGSSASSRDAAGCELFGAALLRFGGLRLKAGGTSMRPAIHPGDVLTVHAVRSEDLCPGDVVLFQRDARLIAHRIVGPIGDRHLTTRGDALSLTDAPVPLADVLGRVTAIQRGPMRLSPQTTPGICVTVASAIVDSVRIARAIVSGATRRLGLRAA